MGTHVSISGPEPADRLEIRELVDAYAHCADRRDAKGQMSLFTKDTHFVVFMDGCKIRETVSGTEPTRRLGARIRRTE